MAKLTPYLFSEDARDQADFYIQALGGELLSVMTHGQMPNCPDNMKDRVLHLSMIAAGIPIYMTDSEAGTINRGNGLSLSLEFPTEAETREAFAKLSEGGNVTHPLEKVFWGSLFGQFKDKFGVMWMISSEAATLQA